MGELLNLQKFVENMEMMDMSEDWCFFVNRTTGEIVTLEVQYLTMAEDGVPASSLFDAEEQEQLQLAETILEHWDDMIRFPDKCEWNEFSMMETFSETCPDEHIRDCLRIALSGRGAFRRFKDTLARFGLAKQWYAFRDAQMLEFARNWCEENQVSCDEGELQ